MATSTEDSVRAVIVGAVESIGGILGFDRANGNVQPYLLEEEIAERLPAYLMAPVGAKQRVRCWGVQVYGREDYSPGIAASRQTGKRFYRILVQGYYGAHGESPVNDLITGARKIREAIKSLNLNLSGTVDSLTELGELRISRSIVENIGVEVFTGTIEGRAEKYSPNW